jgi:hypothetical protein
MFLPFVTATSALINQRRSVCMTQIRSVAEHRNHVERLVDCCVAF